MRGVSSDGLLRCAIWSLRPPGPWGLRFCSMPNVVGSHYYDTNAAFEGLYFLC